MPFNKGKSGNSKGRPIGAVNKTTATAKQAFQLAFDELGGVNGLVAWAKSDPDNLATLYTLYARLIPTDTNVNVKTVDVEFV